jgi:hypothetical protein
MKRSPKLTKRERQTAGAKASHERLRVVAERCRAVIVAGGKPITTTPFERAVCGLLSMYESPAGDEVVDAAIAMIDIAAQGQNLSVEEAIESLVGMCADEVRRDAIKASMDATTAQRLRLLFTSLPTSPTILARSAEFDRRLAAIAKELA